MRALPCTAILLLVAACDEDSGTGFPDAHDVTAEADDITMETAPDVEPGDPVMDMIEEEPGPDPCSIEGLVAGISLENIEATIGVLAAMPERSSVTGQQNALTYLQGRLTEQGVEHGVHTYSWSGRSWTNIEVVIPGGDLLSEIYIMGGHYDSISEYGNAPGADDNASGTAALVEMARVMQGCMFRRTVKLVFFSNEEVGTVGSYYYANNARGRGDDIRGFIALDSIGYGTSTEDIDAVTLPEDAWLVDRVEAVNATWVGAPLVKRVLDACGWGDEGPFWTEGYDAAFLIEDYNPGATMPTNNPYMHTASDTIDTLNMDLVYMTAQVAVATLADLADG